MKKLFYLLAAAAVVLAACNKTYEISLDTTNIEAPAAGGVYTVKLNCNGAWYADIAETSTATVYVVPAEGNGPAEVTLTVTENLTEEPLVAVVLFSCGVAPNAAVAQVEIEQANLTSVSWGGVDYPVKKMKDGNYWFTQNLRYVPEGLTPAKDLKAVTAGIFYPIVVNEAQTGAEFSEDEAVIGRNGYLYQAETALGLKVGDLTTVEAAEALEGARGICPPGWHIPTIDDIIGLVGKAVSPIETDPAAPYYDGTNGSIVKLNEDGFNMDAFGGISIQDNTKTAGTFMGYLKAYPAKISSGMFCGSTCAAASTTYNTSGDPTSGIKNLSFYGFMPMTNKATEAEYTCNGTKVSYRIAAPVRCVKDLLLDK